MIQGPVNLSLYLNAKHSALVAIWAMTPPAVAEGRCGVIFTGIIRFLAQLPLLWTARRLRAAFGSATLLPWLVLAA